jgi:16S rRNA (uracil1498-N3)-methyltransferase
MLSLFFVDSISSGTTQELTGDEGHHAVSVMRLNLGEKIKIADLSGNWVSGGITEIGKKSLKIDVAERGQVQVAKPALVVIQAVTKSDRVKEMLELLTVGGADQITPWQAERCISKWQSDSASKWQIVIKEAAKQARRVQLPILADVVTTNQLIQMIGQSDKVILLTENSVNKLSNLNLSGKYERIILIIGPEGGISDSELTQLQSAGAECAKMGELVLRSAHAGFAALAAIQSAIGRW